MRLIDANAFLKDILTAGIGKTIIEYSESDIGYMIRKRPTVDAVEVVRCKDCIRRYDTDECPMCYLFEGGVHSSKVDGYVMALLTCYIVKDLKRLERDMGDGSKDNG